MTAQTLKIGKRRFVLLPERDFLRLQKKAGEEVVRPEFMKEVLRELKAYRKTGRGTPWEDVKRRLGL
jgi:hypothetical protein